MAATRYRRFLRLCEEWPRDASKQDRDLGTFMRQRIAVAFREGENTQIADPEKCDQMYESLARINSNFYKSKFPRFQDTNFTGVTAEECRMVLNTDNLQQIEDAKKGIWKKLKDKFSKPPEEGSKD
ncbi:ubiquinol-cytochrome-c reductase complex assembly factor 2 [Polypterus senegalus]|uniref:ubiquinol-cytochrome-c reductase complex assembly factor 2 n=1 Tax=Polypterus senegalus TaxID=55291 RepID=UPI0019666DC3|nr:ubiquinol-cytochrome-c reductase complex assembly factor 2 [Polypterus senegalus]